MFSVSCAVSCAAVALSSVAADAPPLDPNPPIDLTAATLSDTDTPPILIDPTIGMREDAVASASFLVGPLDPATQDPGLTPPRDVSFGYRVGKVKWEIVGALAVLTATNIRSVSGDTQSFRFVREGFFGRDTGQLGLDKLAHAWNGYVFTDILYKRMARKAGGGAKTAWTAAALGMALQTYGEIYDGFHRGSGWSWEDMGFNAAGVGFSVMRHTIPGLSDKIDYRTYFVPVNRPEGLGDPDRFEKQRFLFALKGSGFAGIRDTPLRLVELHLGYRAKNFSVTDRQIGLTPERRVFVGVGFNLSEALFKNRRGGASSVARSTLEYLQLPYTSVHTSITK